MSENKPFPDKKQRAKRLYAYSRPFTRFSSFLL